MKMAMKDLWLEYMAIQVSIVMRLVRGKGDSVLVMQFWCDFELCRMKRHSVP